MGVAVPARGPPRAAHRGQPPRGRAREPAAARRRPLRRPVGVRPQGRAAHLGARQGRRRHLRARRSRSWSATAPACSCRDLGGRAGMVDEGQGARRRPRRPRRRPAVRGPQAARGRGLRVRGGRRLPRAAHAPGRRLGAGVLHASRATGSPPTTGRRRRRTTPTHRHRGHREGVGRRRAPHRGRRGQRPGQRPRPGAAPRCSCGAYPQLAHIHLTDYQVRILDDVGRHRRGRPGAHRLHRRRARVDHHRRVAPTSSRRRGRPSSTPSSSASSTPASRFGGVAAPEYVPVDRTGRRPRLRVAAAPARAVAGRPARASSSRRPAPRRPARPPGSRPGLRARRWPAASRASCTLTSRRARARTPWPAAVGVALKRASLFGRAPVVHDLTVALTVWGFLDETPAGARRSCATALFEEVCAPAPLRRAAAASSTLVPDDDAAADARSRSPRPTGPTGAAARRAAPPG